MATQMTQIYKCGVCGNIIEVVHASGGTLVCCGQDMILQIEGSVDASKEKHVPVVEKSGNSYHIKIGSVEHPMEEKHYIEWIELITANKVYRIHLKPGEKAEATFEIKNVIGTVTAREYCNLHGLWKKEA